ESPALLAHALLWSPQSLVFGTPTACSADHPCSEYSLLACALLAHMSGSVSYRRTSRPATMLAPHAVENRTLAETTSGIERCTDIEYQSSEIPRRIGSAIARGSSSLPCTIVPAMCCDPPASRTRTYAVISRARRPLMR